MNLIRVLGMRELKIIRAESGEANYAHRFASFKEGVLLKDFNFNIDIGGWTTVSFQDIGSDCATRLRKLLDANLTAQEVLEYMRNLTLEMGEKYAHDWLDIRADISGGGTLGADQSASSDTVVTDDDGKESMLTTMDRMGNS